MNIQEEFVFAVYDKEEGKNINKIIMKISNYINRCKIKTGKEKMEYFKYGNNLVVIKNKNELLIGDEYINLALSSRLQDKNLVCLIGELNEILNFIKNKKNLLKKEPTDNVFIIDGKDYVLL